jgi:glutathione S-transferase
MSADDFLGQVTLAGWKLAQIADGKIHELELQPSTDQKIKNTYVKGKVKVQLGLTHQKGNTLRIAPVTPRPADMPTIHVYAKAAVIDDGRFDTTELGDCPLCHRVLLSIYEKQLPVEVTLIDLGNKPEWFADVEFAALPVIEYDGLWMDDDEKIAVFLEETFPDPPLAPPAALIKQNSSFESVGRDVYPAFIQLIKAYTVLGHEGQLQEKQAAMVAALTVVDTQLQASAAAVGGAYLGGESICNVDLALFPKLLHAKTVLGKMCGWYFPAVLSRSLDGYMSAMAQRPASTACYYNHQAVLGGWKAKIQDWQSKAGGAVLARLGDKVCVKTESGVQFRMANESAAQ